MASSSTIFFSTKHGPTWWKVILSSALEIAFPSPKKRQRTPYGSFSLLTIPSFSLDQPVICLQANYPSSLSGIRQAPSSPAYVFSPLLFLPANPFGLLLPELPHPLFFFTTALLFLSTPSLAYPPPQSAISAMGS